jgi:uncharacterized protein
MFGVNMGKEVRRELYTAGAGIHVRESSDGSNSREITGYAILFDTPSVVLWEDDDIREREIIDRGAVTQELLDSSDIKFTMFHDRHLILARSNKGDGTLHYEIDERGVKFWFEAPKTVDGDKALELVRRGDLSGCSFAFATKYYDEKFVSRTLGYSDDKTEITHRVKIITDIFDMTLATDPAYPATTVDARELAASDRSRLEEEKRQKEQAVATMLAAHIAEMRARAARKLSGR